MFTVESIQTSLSDFACATLSEITEMSVGAYQICDVGAMVWIRKISQRPCVSALSICALNIAAVSPSTAPWQGRLNGSYVLLAGMLPLWTPRLMKKRDMAGASQPVSPYGLADVQTAPCPRRVMM